MISYERLKEESSTVLRPPRSGLNLYPEYWTKEIGKAAKGFFKWINYDVIINYDTSREYFTHERMFPLFITYIMPMNKTAGYKIIKHILLPGLFLVVIPFLYFIVYLLIIKTLIIRCLYRGLLCHCCGASEKGEITKESKVESK